MLRNDGGNRNHWLTLRLVGTRSNRSAIGTRVRALLGGMTLTAEVRSGGSYISHNDARIHFGLGRKARIERLEIRWPSGRVQTFDNMEADRFVQLKEGGEPETVRLRKP
ncbi:MAG TPA: ASPIC/UnbV domain-containing protein [Blastocatellia bacterium]|nr:ASPIC/UnbV domain-containing protein [Blastocatellia bacterium]